MRIALCPAPPECRNRDKLMVNGFIDESHRAAFESARAAHRRGGPLAKCCGARTRSGSACRKPPLKGHKRCLNHAGPHAARAYRDAQLRDVAAGRLNPAAFEAAEQRRAMNRLRWLWKKHGLWVPGSTIDLGNHEPAFAGQLRQSGWRLETIPPGIVDWLRWKFRRLTIDRVRPEQWAEVLSGLAIRIAAAGPPPDDFSSIAHDDAAFAVPARLPAYSRRRQLDPPRSSVSSRTLEKMALRREPEPSIHGEGAYNLLARRHSDLIPVFARCKSDDDWMKVAAGYHRLCAGQGNPQAHRDWIALIQSLMD